MSREVNAYWAAALLGTLAGMRSMAPAAILGQLSRKGALSGVTGTLALVSQPGVMRMTNLLALGELLADKLPITPNRTAVGPLLGRVFTGAITGAIICSAKKKSVWAGALIGASAAVGAAFGAYALRKRAVKKSHLPDAVIAIGEDVLVGVVGMSLTSRLTRPTPVSVPA
jgi:uncharacterized membrane protein